MPNRAERRAQAKNNRRGVPQQYDQTHGRARSGMLDEYQLQEKSRRLQDGTDGPWKPTGGTIEETESLLTTSPNYTNPKMFKAPHSARQWFRVISWLLIALSAIAFLVIMWLPSHPMWLVATVSIVFAVACSACSSPQAIRNTIRTSIRTALPSDSKAMNVKRGCVREECSPAFTCESRMTAPFVLGLSEKMQNFVTRMKQSGVSLKNCLTVVMEQLPDSKRRAQI